MIIYTGHVFDRGRQGTFVGIKISSCFVNSIIFLLKVCNIFEGINFEGCNLICRVVSELLKSLWLSLVTVVPLQVNPIKKNWRRSISDRDQGLKLSVERVKKFLKGELKISCFKGTFGQASFRFF